MDGWMDAHFGPWVRTCILHTDLKNEICKHKKVLHVVISPVYLLALLILGALNDVPGLLVVLLLLPPGRRLGDLDRLLPSLACLLHVLCLLCAQAW